MIDERLLGLTEKADFWRAPLSEACSRFEIDTLPRQCHFMAQTYHESAGFTRLVENLKYSADGLLKTWPKRFTVSEAKALAGNDKAIAERVYGGRLGNAIEGIGDGYRYRGRGLIQITGRANYRACGRGIGVHLELFPERLELPELAALSAGWFFAENGCLELADSDNINAITRRINGGVNGLAQRVAILERALRLVS